MPNLLIRDLDDASVVVKWFVPEIHSDKARRLLNAPHEYVAPDLPFAETANTIWKKIRTLHA